MIAFAIGCALTAGGLQAGAASSTTVVSVTVPSATSLATGGCPNGAAGITSFGTVLPGSSVVTPSPCVLSFGSSNDTAALRAYQADRSLEAMNASSATGALDTAFDGDAAMPGFPGNGAVRTSWGLEADTAGRVVVQPDGKVLVLGVVGIGGVQTIGLARYLTNGQLDSTFDGDAGMPSGSPGNGKVSTTISGAQSSTTTEMALQADGKILVSGYADFDLTAGVNEDFILIRYDSNGALDTAFDGSSSMTCYPCNGILRWSIAGANSDQARSVVTNPQTGAIAVAGTADLPAPELVVSVFHADGTFDTSFDGPSTMTGYPGNGTTRLDVVPAFSPSVRGLTVDAEGRWLVAGYAGNDVWIVRLVQGGTVDGTFDGDSTRTGYPFNGIVTYDLSTQNDLAKSISLTHDGRILLGGNSDTDLTAGTQWDAFIVRMLSDGSLDTSFSGDGIVFSTGVDLGDGRAVAQPDGKVLISGNSGCAGGFPCAVTSLTMARYNSDGAADTTFGSSGTYSIDVQGFPSAASRTVWSNGTIYTVGYLTDGTDADWVLLRMAGASIPDYENDGAPDSSWTDGSGLFGACLKSVAGAGTTATWATNGTCDATNVSWNPIARTSSGLTAKIASSTTIGSTTSQVTLHFGLRVPSSATPAEYVAPIVFEVTAPST